MAQDEKSERVNTVLFYGVVLLLVYLLFRVFEAFLVPLGWAAVLVICFQPIHARIRARWGEKRAPALSTLAITLLLILPMVFVLTAFITEGIGALRSLQEAQSAGQLPGMGLVHRAVSWIQGHVPGQAQFDPAVLIRESAEKVGGFIATRAGAVLRNALVFLFDLFIVIFATYYFLRDSDKIMRGLRNVLPFDADHRERIIAQSRDLIYASVTSTLLIAGIQGFLGGIAFAVVGLPSPVFWGVMMAFTSLVPVVGAGLIWAPAALYLFATGATVRGIILVVICVGIVGSADNLLRPILLSGKSPLNGLLILISVLGGISVFGMLGLVMGPIVVATAWSLVQVYTRRETNLPSPSIRAQ